VLKTLKIKYLIEASRDIGPKLQCKARMAYKHMLNPTIHKYIKKKSKANIKIDKKKKQPIIRNGNSITDEKKK